ncbi:MULTISPECIES: DUF6282 family protein [unclassified Microcoleus]|uniref:DUF6282 family protein n=1 Tax=unclassified Microcoleus TaxID=2642155 RepID=UPI002FD74EA5
MRSIKLKIAAIVAIFGIVCCGFCQPVCAVGDSQIEGAIDFHVHSSPDVIPRRLDDFEVAESAARSHMKAVVLKNHYASTAARAVLVNKIVPQIQVFGGIVLNRAIGGLNPDAVEAMHRIAGEFRMGNIMSGRLR